MKYFLLLLTITFVAACHNTSDQGSNPKTVIIPKEPSKFGVKEDCYKDRKTVKIVGNRSAKILVAGGVSTIDCYELGERYDPCELPDWAVDGTEVIISGITKSVFENERRAGTPFVISEIKKK